MNAKKFYLAIGPTALIIHDLSFVAPNGTENEKIMMASQDAPKLNFTNRSHRNS